MNLIGFLAIRNDVVRKKQPLPAFRPSVAACMHADLPIEHYYLLYPRSHYGLLRDVIKDIERVSPQTHVHPVELNLDDAFDPACVFDALLNFVEQQLDDETPYLISLSAGTHIQIYSWLRIMEARFIKATFLQIHNSQPAAAEKLTDDRCVAGEYRILDLDASRFDRYQQRLLAGKSQTEQHLKHGIPTKNAAYNVMIKKMERISSQSQGAILIDGPTGAGKTQLASRLYQVKVEQGAIKGGFIAVNCATLSPEHAQSALFGHVKGAFTGALQARKGFLREADGGVLFLDEVGTLPLAVQGMLLHAIEQKSFYPMGSDKLCSSNFTLICGTNACLQSLVKAGLFRDDLFARINLWHFTLPSLAQRREDIPANLEYELKRLPAKQGVKVRFNREAKLKYLDFAGSESALWQRNFRDLCGSVERMAALSEQGIITEAVVEDEILRLLRSWSQDDNQDRSVASLNDAELQRILGKHYHVMCKLDICQFLEVFQQCQTHTRLSDAARALYNSTQGELLSQNPAGRLQNYLSRLDLTFEAVKKIRQ